MYVTKKRIVLTVTLYTRLEGRIRMGGA